MPPASPASLQMPSGAALARTPRIPAGSFTSYASGLTDLPATPVAHWSAASRPLQRERTIRLLGTLDEPVHAGNLARVMATIDHANPQRHPVLAVDACLGKAGSVGQITVNMGPLRPGAGVAKDLPPVGNVHIAGVVNVGGFMEYLVLQNTRLSTVMRMADAIARGIYTYVSGS